MWSWRDVWREQKLARNLPVTRSETVLRCTLKICMPYYVTWAHKILSLKAFEWLQSTYAKFRRKTRWDASSYFQRGPNHKQTEVQLTSTVYNIRKPITIQNSCTHTNQPLPCLANPTKTSSPDYTRLHVKYWMWMFSVTLYPVYMHLHVMYKHRQKKTLETNW